MDAVLTRDLDHPTATLGRLRMGKREWHTLEPPWRDNQRNVSCIPPGYYQAVPRQSPRFGRTYWMLAVPDRSWILIHAGNLPKHTLGCVLLGLHRGSLHGDPAVWCSRAALLDFFAAANGAPVNIEVTH